MTLNLHTSKQYYVLFVFLSGTMDCALFTTSTISRQSNNDVMLASIIGPYHWLFSQFLLQSNFLDKNGEWLAESQTGIP